MEALALHTGEPTAHCEDNTSCIYVVEDKRVTPRVKHIDIPVCFLHEQFDNGLFIKKIWNSSVIPADMFTKQCSGPIISQITQWMTGLRFYPNRKKEYYQFMILHAFIVK